MDRTIEIYADTRGLSKCNGADCGKRILWAEIVGSGKKMCFDPEKAVPLRTYHGDGRRLVEVMPFEANHWASCPNARRFDSKAPAKKAKSKTHQCYVSYCNVQVPETYLMCPRHWAKVSPATMREVWKWYRAKMADPDNEAATGAHWEAIEKARREVESKESGPLLDE